jgi:REP element-mobilizing transposase RayT
MAKVRKRHVQQVMFDAKGCVVRGDGKRVDRNGKTIRGGARPGAGRPPKGKRAGAPHKARPALKRWQPVHVVLRVVDDMGSLRKRHMYKAVREASIAVAKRELNYVEDGAFRIVHISIQRNHVHLLVEADHKMALSRGLQSFEISAAKHLNRAVSIARIKRADSHSHARDHGRSRNGDADPSPVRGQARAFSVTAAKRVLRANRALRRRGAVFPDRFHEEIISTPKQARNALAYVLNNWRKHSEDRVDFAKTWNVDPYSTGVYFDGWKELERATVMWEVRETYQPLVVYLPKTWLLRVGWRKHGLIPFDYVPSARQMERARAAA